MVFLKLILIKLVTFMIIDTLNKIFCTLNFLFGLENKTALVILDLDSYLVLTANGRSVGCVYGSIQGAYGSFYLGMQ